MKRAPNLALRATAFGFVLAGALTASAAQEAGGTLAACLRAHADPAAAALCVRLAQRQASDDMLGALREAQRTVRRLDDASVQPELAAALTTSQRDFERYVQGHCTFVHAALARTGGADLAALACETDLLRQRVTVLQAFGRTGSNN